MSRARVIRARTTISDFSSLSYHPQDLDYADEKTGRIGGGLDELNTILSTTQKKLNRFKVTVAA